MYTCRVWLWQPRASQIVLSDVQSIPGAQLDRRICHLGRGVKVQLSSQLRSEIHRCKRRRQQRNMTENTSNQHTTSIFEQRQIHRETSYRRKLTADGKNWQYNAVIEHACYTPDTRHATLHYTVLWSIYQAKLSVSSTTTGCIWLGVLTTWSHSAPVSLVLSSTFTLSHDS